MPPEELFRSLNGTLWAYFPVIFLVSQFALLVGLMSVVHEVRKQGDSARKKRG